MVVDENESTAMTLKEVLETTGCSVVSACNGKECVEKAVSEKPDMIIIDTLLPDTHDIIRTLRFKKGGEMSKLLIKEKCMKYLISAIICAMLVFGLTYVPLALANESQIPVAKRMFTKHFQKTLFDITQHAAFSVEVLLDEKEYKIGKNVIGIALHDENDSDVIGAKIRVTFKDLVTGDLSAGPFIISDKGNGLYTVSGLDLQKEGRWELSVTVKKDRAEDSVTFILPDALRKPYPKGRYSP
jgi:CheY-like chemotaxis protein